MIAVIFELTPKPGQADNYFALAADLRSTLETIEGFISIERFQSVSDPDKYLSLSFWQDENAVARWRNRDVHRNAQQQGRDSILSDYRLRVATVVRDYGMQSRSQVPADSKQFHNSQDSGSANE